MAHEKFDLRKIARLDDVGRFDTLRPDVMWAALGSPNPRVIVELGAGTGLFAEKFSDLAPDATVYAVDVEQAMIDWMHEHRAGVAAGRLVPVLSTETVVPLNDSVADLVTMINVHHELEDPSGTYAEVLRLLVSGGQLLVVDWAPVETPKGPPQAVRVSAEQILASLEDAGFERAVVHVGALPWHSLVTAVRP